MQYKLLTLDSADFNKKTVLVRLDLNVPVLDGKITDFSRIDSILPTLTELIEKKAKVIILSHFGRPKGKVNTDYSLHFIREVLEERLKTDVAFFPATAEQTSFENVKSYLSDSNQASVVLLENLRFYAEEEANDPFFAKKLASLGVCYVNDAFSVSHRAHASTEGVTKFLPSYAGRHLQSEIEALQSVLGSPKKPVMAIIGGSKVSTKIDVLNHLVKIVDHLVVGGGMANTFLAAQGKQIGQSLYEKEYQETALRILAEAEKTGCQILLPHDVIIASSIKDKSGAMSVSADNVPDDQMILDIGESSVEEIKQVLFKCNSLLWNGPLGAFEYEPFDQATLSIAHAANIATQENGLVSVAGGGDTLAALEKAGVKEKMTHVSTAGGAFLEWIEGKTLPGIKPLFSEQKAIHKNNHG